MGIAIDSGKTLQEQAVGVGLSWTWLGIKKTLKGEEKEKAAELWDANPEVLSLSKKIINTKNEFYSVLTKIKSKMTSLWIDTTFPWVESGVRLIRQEDVAAFKEEYAQYAEKLKDAASLLTKNWGSIKEEAKKDLGELFSESNYPSNPGDLFSFEVCYPNLCPPEYLKTIDPKLYEVEKARISAAFDKAVELAISAYGEELHKLVVSTTEKLTPDKEGNVRKLKSNSMDALKEFIERFRKMNVTSSVELENLISQTEELVCGMDLKSLKSSPLDRKELAQKFETLSLSIETKLVPKKRRTLLLGTPALKIAPAPSPEEEQAGVA